MNGAVGYGFPRYLHRPYRLLWFEKDELLLMVAVYILAILTTLKTLLLIPLAVLVYRREKQKRPRGFMRHVLYRLGIISFARYPEAFVTRFFG